MSPPQPGELRTDGRVLLVYLPDHSRDVAPWRQIRLRDGHWLPPLTHHAVTVDATLRPCGSLLALLRGSTAPLESIPTRCFRPGDTVPEDLPAVITPDAEVVADVTDSTFATLLQAYNVLVEVPVRAILEQVAIQDTARAA